MRQNSDGGVSIPPRSVFLGQSGGQIDGRENGSLGLFVHLTDPSKPELEINSDQKNMEQSTLLSLSLSLNTRGQSSMPLGSSQN